MSRQTAGEENAQKRSFTVEEGRPRIDRFLATRVAGVSRSEIQRVIRAGGAMVNGKECTIPSYRLRSGECVVITLPPERLLVPSFLDLAIIYEDETIVVVDKPVGVTVHPGAGKTGTTLVEGLLVDRKLPVEDDPARPGIVHRLDKETSGVLVIAKTRHALGELKQQFAARKISKIYLAQVAGRIEEQEGLIDAPIGRDPAHPRRMTIRPGGREAQTQFHVLYRTNEWTLLFVHPFTGRTHQIRVHARYIGHPVLGDPLYGTRTGNRMMLHAWRLVLAHPTSGKKMSFTAPIPSEFPIPEDMSLDDIAATLYS